MKKIVGLMAAFVLALAIALGFGATEAKAAGTYTIEFDEEDEPFYFSIGDEYFGADSPLFWGDGISSVAWYRKSVTYTSGSWQTTSDETFSENYLYKMKIWFDSGHGHLSDTVYFGSKQMSPVGASGGTGYCYEVELGSPSYVIPDFNTYEELVCGETPVEVFDAVYADCYGFDVRTYGYYTTDRNEKLYPTTANTVLAVEDGVELAVRLGVKPLKANGKTLKINMYRSPKVNGSESYSSAYAEYLSTTPDASGYYEMMLTIPIHHAAAEYVRIPATDTKDGYIGDRCSASICKTPTDGEVIPKLTEFELQTKTYIADGKEKKPAIRVYDSEGNIIDNEYFTITYKNNVKAGTATVNVFADSKTYKINKDVTFQIKNPSVRYRTYVQTYGWQPYVKDGATSGTVGQAKRLEGINIELVDPPVSGGITYRTYCQTYGWMPWSSNGAFNGTRGEAKRLESIQIKLTGEMANKYDVWYRVQAQKFGWMGWAKNEAKSGTAAYGYRLEAIQIKIVVKGSPAPGKTTDAFKSRV